MNWKKSSTGNTVATAPDGRRFCIGRLVCFDVNNKAVYRWRLRVNEAAVGGAENTRLFPSISSAKKYAESLK